MEIEDNHVIVVTRKKNKMTIKSYHNCETNIHFMTSFFGNKTYNNENSNTFTNTQTKAVSLMYKFILLLPKHSLTHIQLMSDI